LEPPIQHCPLPPYCNSLSHISDALHLMLYVFLVAFSLGVLNVFCIKNVSNQSLPFCPVKMNKSLLRILQISFRQSTLDRSPVCSVPRLHMLGSAVRA
jgi:hypothetical protein